LTAAVRAAELGLKVVVLEQGRGPKHLCNSRMSGGVFHLSYTDVTKPAVELASAVNDATRQQSDQELVAAIAETSGRALSWLQGKGAKFVRQADWRTVLMPPRPLAAGDAWVGRGMDLLLDRLVATLTSLGGEIHHGVRATSLLMHEGVCTGVVAVTDTGEKQILAKNVIIADGGFQSNQTLFKKALGPRPDLVVQRGAATGFGDGLQMAENAGAEITDLRGFYGHILSADALHNERLRPYPILDEFAASSVVVDRSGKRLFDEGQGGIVMANRLATMDDPASAIIVADSEIWDEVGKGGPYLPTSYVQEVGGTVHRANALAELAQLAGIDHTQLQATIDGYNTAVRTNTIGDLVPRRSTRGVWRQVVPPRMIVKSPYFAIPIRPGITHTMGGIAIDGAGRVRRRSPEGHIEGLFAIGSSIGGLEGGPDAGYVGGLMKGVIFGLRAAECIAENRLEESK
jgi:fumarate reductase flavoprotein subunit